MDDIDSILNDFDAIYDKANKENSTQQRGASVEEDEDELAVMDFMTAAPSSSSKHQGYALSMESNDNLDEEINSFIRKNSTTDNIAALKASKGGKRLGKGKHQGGKGKKSATVAEIPSEVVEDEVASDRDSVRDQTEEDVHDAADDGAYDDQDEDQEEDYREEEPEDYAEDPEEEEEEVPSAQAQLKEKPYQTDMTRPVVQYGKTKLTYGEAKLYGLLDENGEVKLKKNDDSFARSREAVLHSRAMAERKEPRPHAPTEEELEMTFKPSRSKEASKAMMSRGCGYDFVNRLDEGGDFLQRAFAKGEKGKTEKRMQEAQKEDYDARLDKLKCPNCNKFQAFDEFIEKKRSCQQCHVRYVKGSVSHPKAYARKQEEAEQRKRERLKKIEDELYPPHPKPTGKPSGKSLIERTNELMAAQKEQARFEMEQKRKAEIEALARARAPPRPVTQPVHVPAAAEQKTRVSTSNKLNATTNTVGAKSTKGPTKLKGAIKQSIISEKFNKLIQYPKDNAEMKS